MAGEKAAATLHSHPVQEDITRLLHNNIQLGRKESLEERLMWRGGERQATRRLWDDEKAFEMRP